MPTYLVIATPVAAHLHELSEMLDGDLIDSMEPFGEEMAQALRQARVEPEGDAVWEEVCFCPTPLAQEWAAVLDRYFDDIRTTEVSRHEGWRRIESLPKLF